MQRCENNIPDAADQFFFFFYHDWNIWETGQKGSWNVTPVAQQYDSEHRLPETCHSVVFSLRRGNPALWNLIYLSTLNAQKVPAHQDSEAYIHHTNVLLIKMLTDWCLAAVMFKMVVM